MSVIRTLILSCFVAAMIAGCAKIEEPWVPGNQLSKERNRSSQESRELQERMTLVQTDR